MTENIYAAPDLDQNTISVIVVSGSLVAIAGIAAAVYVWYYNKKEKDKKGTITAPLLGKRNTERQKRTFSTNIL